MKSGVTSSGSPNQNGRTSGSPKPAFATSRIFEPRSDWTVGRAVGIVRRFSHERRTAPAVAAVWQDRSMLDAADSLDLAALGARLRAGDLRPRDVVDGVLTRIGARGDDKVWIHRAPRAALEARADELERRGPAGLPLYGIPFAVKDNIDVDGQPTTAACPEFAYTPAASAPVVQALVDAGAIAIGKTNLDQFATGL